MHRCKGSARNNQQDLITNLLGGGPRDLNGSGQTKQGKCVCTSMCTVYCTLH